MTDPIKTEPRDSHGRFATEPNGEPTRGVARVVDKAGAALGTSRDAAADAARRTAQSIDANPLGILVGGLALGALVGAFIPRSAQEKELLAPLGKTIGERARAALAAARETGQAELGELGLTRDAARSQVRGLVENLTKVAQHVGTAAAKSATERA